MSKECFTKEDRKAACDFIINDPVVKQYLYNDTWQSGSTIVYPTTIYGDSISIMLWNNRDWNEWMKSRNRNKKIRRLYSGLFKGFFDRLFISKFGAMFDKRHCYFSSNYGSSPDKLEFKFKGWID